MRILFYYVVNHLLQTKTFQKTIISHLDVKQRPNCLYAFPELNMQSR